MARTQHRPRMDFGSDPSGFRLMSLFPAYSPALGPCLNSYVKRPSVVGSPVRSLAPRSRSSSIGLVLTSLMLESNPNPPSLTRSACDKTTGRTIDPYGPKAFVQFQAD